MVLDIDIALFAKNHRLKGGDGTTRSDHPHQWRTKRARAGLTPLSRTTPIDQIAKHMRYTAHKRHEQHSKQVQMLLDQRRFAQNETWRHEYDRLRGSHILSAEDQTRIDARLNDLLKQGLMLK